MFRDQEFSGLAGDASSRAVTRIQDVRVLRTAQFPEDAGPDGASGAARPYLEINNFYTVTVYEKGAEVVRMMQTLLGREGFARGMELYFERHDGQAVTCDDFAQAIADANPDSTLARLLEQFKRWYSQAGTPRVRASGLYDAARAHLPPDAGAKLCTDPGPGRQGTVRDPGRPRPARRRRHRTGERHARAHAGQRDRRISTASAASRCPSILRGFSAPVILEFDYSDAQLITLLAHDTDPFNRWEAGQRLAVNRALGLHPRHGGSTPRDIRLDAPYIEAMRSILRHPTLDAAFKELVLTLPAETYIAEQLDLVDPQRIHAVREAMREQLARELAADWEWAFERTARAAPTGPIPVSAGRRALTGMALSNLCLAARLSGDAIWPGKAYQRFKDAGNMTDRFNALAALVTSGSELAAARACSASMRSSRTRRWCWTSGSRCRPARRTAAATCCRRSGS